MNISGLQKDCLHHAYLVVGGAHNFDELQQGLALLFGVEGFVGNPDVFVRKLNAFSVSDARAVVTFAGRSALVRGASKIIIISFSTITREAQNALLKTLEEPAKDTYLFLLTPNPDMLLPTVLSRCMRVEFGETSRQRGSLTVSESADAFIKATVPERLKIIEKINKGKDKSANKTAMLEILSGVEAHLVKNKNIEGWRQGAQAVLQAQEYMRDKGAMSKMLMESVALVI